MSESDPRVYCAIEQCSVCGGSGEVVISCLLSRDGTMKPVVRTECIACDGFGKRVIEFGSLHSENGECSISNCR